MQGREMKKNKIERKWMDGGKKNAAEPFLIRAV